MKKDYLDSFGNVPTSPWVSGEQATRTAAVVHGASRKTEVSGPGERTWDEPDVVSPSRSMNTVVFQAKNGGNSIVVNDEGSDGDGFMLITHNSGTVVQIDQHGTVLIKSQGDTYNTTEGLHFKRSEGDTNDNIGGDWNVKVERGSNNVWVQGDVNIECENYNLEVRGKATINAAEALELRGAKVSIEGSVTDIDMAAAQVIRQTAVNGTINLASKGDMVLATQAGMHLNGATKMVLNTSGEEAPFNVKATGKIDMIATGVAYLDGSEVRLGENDGAEATAKPENAKMPKLKTPEARRPSENSGDGVSMIQPTPNSLSDRNGDDES